MEFRQLKYFVEIVEQGTLTRAAQVLHIAQPALSQQMASLETQLGVKLLGRSVRGVKATEAGAAFYKYAVAILKQVEAARQAVKQISNEPSGSVSVGLPASTAAILGLPFVREVRERLPRVMLELVESPSAYLSELVTNGRIDLAILFCEKPTGGLAVSPLFSEALYFVGAPKSLPKGSTISLTDLSKHPLLLSSRGNSLREHVETAFKNAGLDYQLIAEINATDMLVQLIAERQGFGILPWSAVHAHHHRSLLDSREIVKPRLSRGVAVCVSDVLPVSYPAERVREVLLGVVSRLVASGAWKGVTLTR